MCNLWFNIRFKYHHWQWGPDGMKWTYNNHQRLLEEVFPEDWKKFEVYTIFGYNV
jgi:hypothetical protein